MEKVEGSSSSEIVWCGVLIAISLYWRTGLSLYQVTPHWQSASPWPEKTSMVKINIYERGFYSSNEQGWLIWKEKNYYKLKLCLVIGEFDNWDYIWCLLENWARTSPSISHSVILLVLKKFSFHCPLPPRGHPAQSTSDVVSSFFSCSL